MKKYIICSLVAVMLLSCSISNNLIVGNYISECKLYGYSEFTIEIREDSTYAKVRPYMDGITSIGKWSIKNDSLILTDLYEITNGNKEFIDSTNRFYELKHIYKIKKGILIDITFQEKKYQCKLIRR